MKTENPLVTAHQIENILEKEKENEIITADPLLKDKIREHIEKKKLNENKNESSPPLLTVKNYMRHGKVYYKPVVVKDDEVPLDIDEETLRRQSIQNITSEIEMLKAKLDREKIEPKNRQKRISSYKTGIKLLNSANERVLANIYDTGSDTSQVYPKNKRD